MPDLGRYAFAVLASYGATLVLLGGLTLATVLRNRRVRRQLERAEKRREALDG